VPAALIEWENRLHEVKVRAVARCSAASRTR
jgi:hypothetical protein